MLQPIRNALYLAIVVLTVGGCNLDNPAASDHQPFERPLTWQKHLKSFELPKESALAMRESIYVPVYSHIYYENHKRLLELAETVSMRNTDSANPIILTTVRHYGSDGKLLKDFLSEPILLQPMATADFVVPRSDITGGTGANFIIEWVSDREVTDPIAEAIMISTGSSHSISFVSRGVILKKEKLLNKSDADAVLKHVKDIGELVETKIESKPKEEVDSKVTPPPNDK